MKEKKRDPNLSETKKNISETQISKAYSFEKVKSSELRQKEKQDCQIGKTVSDLAINER